MDSADRNVTIEVEETDTDQSSASDERSNIPLSVSIRRDDLIDAVDEMAEGQFTIEEYIREKARFGPVIRVID